MRRRCGIKTYHQESDIFNLKPEKNLSTKNIKDYGKSDIFNCKTQDDSQNNKKKSIYVYRKLKESMNEPLPKEKPQKNFSLKEYQESHEKPTKTIKFENELKKADKNNTLVYNLENVPYKEKQKGVKVFEHVYKIKESKGPVPAKTKPYNKDKLKPDPCNMLANHI